MPELNVSLIDRPDNRANPAKWNVIFQRRSRVWKWIVDFFSYLNRAKDSKRDVVGSRVYSSLTIAQSTTRYHYFLRLASTTVWLAVNQRFFVNRVWNVARVHFKRLMTTNGRLKRFETGVQAWPPLVTKPIVLIVLRCFVATRVLALRCMSSCCVTIFNNWDSRLFTMGNLLWGNKCAGCTQYGDMRETFKVRYWVGETCTWLKYVQSINL